MLIPSATVKFTLRMQGCMSYLLWIAFCTVGVDLEKCLRVREESGFFTNFRRKIENAILNKG